jgi:phospholipid/cholesterol/gamma-HCH transport system substrate-binding protein
MISRMVRVQVLVFAVVSLLGVAYVGFRYVGLGERWFGGTYQVQADFAEAGGIFTNAAVTYRGVPVGRVGPITLRGDGVRVALVLDGRVRVPADVTAVVAHRSAVGEQYVDLRPRTDTGPYLAGGDVIARDRTATPPPLENLLSNLDALVGSVGAEDLSVVIDELGVAFEGNEDALRRLLDANSALLAEADHRLPETLALIRDGRTVLQTQVDSASAIREWAASLAQFAETLRTADPDLRRLLAQGPGAAKELMRLLRDLDPALGTLVGNLVTVNDIAVRRLPGLEQILVVYPVALAGGFTVVPGDGTAHLGLVLNANDPPACNYVRSGSPDCTAGERSGGSGVRGAASAPRAGAGASSGPPGGPLPEGSGPGGPTPGSVTVAGFDPATGLVVGPDGQPLLFGGTGGQARLAGDQSWKQLLLAGLAP